MVLYMTSSPTGAYRNWDKKDFEGLDPSNGLVEELKKDWIENSKCLILSSDPQNYKVNDEMGSFFLEILKKTGLSVSTLEICDLRNMTTIMHKVKEYDFILLAGGHVPTQNQFFEYIHLRYLLYGFQGIIMGISAGSMNCAEEVYAQPELEGEVQDPSYCRFMTGLGLTNIRVIPHYQAIKEDVVDGKRIMEEVAYPDSMGREFYALVDGSYILKRNGVEELHGEGYLIRNGKKKKICDRDQIYTFS